MDLYWSTPWLPLVQWGPPACIWRSWRWWKVVERERTNPIHLLSQGSVIISWVVAISLNLPNKFGVQILWHLGDRISSAKGLLALTKCTMAPGSFPSSCHSPRPKLPPFLLKSSLPSYNVTNRKLSGRPTAFLGLRSHHCFPSPPPAWGLSQEWGVTQNVPLKDNKAQYRHVLHPSLPQFTYKSKTPSYPYIPRCSSPWLCTPNLTQSSVLP